MSEYVYQTDCSECGKQVAVVPDSNDASKFHYECLNCGHSVELTVVKE
jgi:DNA-directed RNA polymerase subunit RPC12/RpoP